MTRALGLDLGGTNIKVAVLENGEGGRPQVVATASRPTHAHLGPAAVVERLVAAGREAIAEHGPVTRVGIGVPGLFEAGSGSVVLFPNLPGPWKGRPLREPVSDGLGLPATMINDARAFTLAEGTVGAGRGRRIVVGLTLGTGIGGGVMIDGAIALGAFGTAGELGHQTVQPDGPICGCGNRGCAEPLAQASALAALAGRSSAVEVCRDAAAGDPRCLDAIETVAGYLGIAIGNVVHVLGPDIVVIGGGIAAAGELVIGPIRRAVSIRATLAPDNRPEVVAASLGEMAGAIGAGVAGMGQAPTRSR